MKGKILLADDEKGIAAVMKEYFELSGYQVKTAYSGSGQEATEKLSCLPDLVLPDINMPESVEEIRQSQWVGSLPAFKPKGWRASTALH